MAIINCILHEQTSTAHCMTSSPLANRSQETIFTDLSSIFPFQVEKIQNKKTNCNFNRPEFLNAHHNLNYLGHVSVFIC